MQAMDKPCGTQYTHEGRDHSPPSCVFAGFCRNPVWRSERLHVGSLPSLGALHHVELHGLTFLQALETA